MTFSFNPQTLGSLPSIEELLASSGIRGPNPPPSMEQLLRGAGVRNLQPLQIPQALPTPVPEALPLPKRGIGKLGKLGAAAGLALPFLGASMAPGGDIDPMAGLMDVEGFTGNFPAAPKGGVPTTTPEVKVPQEMPQDLAGMFQPSVLGGGGGGTTDLGLDKVRAALAKIGEAGRYDVKAPTLSASKMNLQKFKMDPKAYKTDPSLFPSQEVAPPTDFSEMYKFLDLSMPQELPKAGMLERLSAALGAGAVAGGRRPYDPTRPFSSVSDILGTVGGSLAEASKDDRRLDAELIRGRERYAGQRAGAEGEVARTRRGEAQEPLTAAYNQKKGAFDVGRDNLQSQQRTDQFNTNLGVQEETANVQNQQNVGNENAKLGYQAEVQKAQNQLTFDVQQLGFEKAMAALAQRMQAAQLKYLAEVGGGGTGQEMVNFGGQGGQSMAQNPAQAAFGRLAVSGVLGNPESRARVIPKDFLAQYEKEFGGGTNALQNLRPEGVAAQRRAQLTFLNTLAETLRKQGRFDELRKLFVEAQAYPRQVKTSKSTGGYSPSNLDTSDDD